ncbi:MAG: NrpR regulatory domain-containing protein [Kiritimatiellae bacterium]|nr:NrpR regulatory domain-containing protein [Kiritimatiellia bacterium]
MNNDKQSRRRMALLEVLKQHDRPVISHDIAHDLQKRGYDTSERTVRLDLQKLDQEGITINHGRRGHVLSPTGLAELRNARTLERIGYLSVKIDAMTYGMDFDLERRAGTVVINTTVCEPRQLRAALGEIVTVFAKGYAMGTLVALMGPGERVGEVTIPEERIGFCTVCSVTLNGVLLKHGVPTRSRFGGLLEMRDGVATRFAEAITYDGTSLDPLVVFIRGGFTNYRGAIGSGNGLIGASFREIPAGARDLAGQLAGKLAAIGLGGFLEIGPPGCELFGIPTSEGCCGAVVIGGLNPVSIMEERGDHVTATALSGFLEYNRLFSYTELGARLAAMTGLR